jgi:hypothetical protein
VVDTWDWSYQIKLSIHPVYYRPSVVLAGREAVVMNTMHGLVLSDQGLHSSCLLQAKCSPDRAGGWSGRHLGLVLSDQGACRLQQNLQLACHLHQGTLLIIHLCIWGKPCGHLNPPTVPLKGKWQNDFYLNFFNSWLHQFLNLLLAKTLHIFFLFCTSLF